MPPSRDFVFDGYDKVVIDHYEMLTTFLVGCSFVCERDINWNGYSVNKSLCFLSKCNKYIDGQCPKCFFGRKLIPTNTVSCPSHTSSSMPVTTSSSDGTVATTQSSRNVSESSVADGTENNSNVTLCHCICTNASRSLSESIEMRRNELKVNKAALNSSIRRRTSASDHRMSSRVIGAVGIIIIVIFGMLIICSDVFSVFYSKSKTV